MTEEMALGIVHALVDLRVNAAVGVIAPEDMGDADWQIMVPPGQPLDMTDIVEEMRKLGVRVKIGEEGALQFWPPPEDLPETAEEVVDVETGEEPATCMRTKGRFCRNVPCEVCGNGVTDWLDIDSTRQGVTQIQPAVLLKFGIVAPPQSPFKAGVGV